MKSKSMGTGEGRKKSFYMALFACAGAVVVLALVITFSNSTKTPDPQEQEYAMNQPEENETVAAGSDTTQSYRNQADLDQALFRPKATASQTPDTEKTAEPTAQPSSSPSVPVESTTGQENLPSAQPTQPANEPSESTDTSASDASDETASSDEANEPNETTETSEPVSTNDSSDSDEASAAAAATFEPFTEQDRMTWPVYGDIAMIFSQDALVYNPTLDQWRTNDDLRISAQEGTPVRASAAGKVTEIGNDRVYGNFVRIDNGNGWETIYGQLMESVLVSEGDIVQSGQVIGGVGRPSIFSVLNGHHVSLRVMRDDQLVDPRLVLLEIPQDAE